MSDKQARETEMEQRQAQDEARAACGCPPRRCLVCGAREPCMTEADLKPGDPGVPCTFDLTYAQLVALLHRKDDTLRAQQADLLRLSNERNVLLNERAAWREAEAELRLALEMKQQTIEQIRQGCEEDTARLDWLSRPENYDVEFVLSQAGYRIQQLQQVPGTHEFEFQYVRLTSRDWPTLREALDDAIERDRG